MKKKLYILLLFFPVMSFCQDINTKTKTIRGFIFEKYLVPTRSEVYIKGTDVKTETDIDGKFTIEAKEGDVLLIPIFGKKAIEIIVTEKNCYTVEFFTDTGLYYYTKKSARIMKKTRRKAMRKYKQGFYDCND